MADVRGSVIAVTNAAGSVTSKNAYDAYGAPASGNVGRFQYAGQMWMAELKLYHFKARAYHPALGRFLQTDPIGYGDGLNLYQYAGSDPVNARDTSGLTALCHGTPTGVRCQQGGGGGSADIRDFLNAFNQTLNDLFRDSFGPGEGGGACGANALQPSLPAPVVAPPPTRPTTAPTIPVPQPVANLLRRSGIVGLALMLQGDTRERRQPQILYHYTSGEGLGGILASESIISSGADSRFGAGVYFTDIVPGTNSPRNLANRIGGPISNRTHVVAVNVAGLPVVQDDPARAPNNYRVPYPAGAPLSVAGRIEGSGPNQPCE